MTADTTSYVQLDEYGDETVLRLRSGGIPVPGPQDIVVRHTAIGVNFHDIYVRSGLYKTLSLPGVPGIEAVGIVEALGAAVDNLAVGDRIGYVSPSYGAYASHRILPAELAIALPDEVSDVAMAGSLMKMLTTCMLVRKIHQVRPGEVVVVHAAAGGVGQLLCSWSKALGARVIGTVGHRAKRDAAHAAGADHVLLYREENTADRVAALTDGAGADVVYDAIGRDTFLNSLQCLNYAGTLVNYGQASGAVEPFTPDLLAAKSLSLVRPILFHYLRTREQRQALSEETFAALRAGFMRPAPARVFALADAANAHRLLQAGQSPGAIVLVPEGTCA